MNRSAVVRIAVGTMLLAGCSLIWPERYKLREAEELEAQGRYTEAVVLYELVFTKYPKEREALEALSRAAAVYEERLNNWQKAAAYLQDLRARTEGKPGYATVMLRLARVLEHAGTPYRDSLETYGVLCRNCASAPEAVSALVAQGRLQESMGNWAAAKGVYEDALARYGASPEAPTVRVRLEAVWQLEATGLYYSGEVDHAVTLAEEAMKKGVTVDEVRNGLESLLMRYRGAERVWKADAASIVKQDAVVTENSDSGQFIYRCDRGTPPEPPPGWAVEYDAKRKRITVKETPPPPEPEPSVAAAIDVTRTVAGAAVPPPPKPKPKPKPKPRPAKLWSWKSPSDLQVLGWWFSPDGQYLGWLAKSREGKKRTLNILDLKKHSTRVAIADSTGRMLGQVMAFMPRGKKILVPYKDYLMVSDFRGGLQATFPIEGDSKARAPFRGKDVEWIATTSDGLEVLMAVSVPPPKKKKGSPPPETPPPVIWKVSLGVASF